MKKTILLVYVFGLLVLGGKIKNITAAPYLSPGPSILFTANPRSQPLIIDHTKVDITAIPQQYIEAAKNDLNIYYGHTSHGSQLMYGMEALVDFADGGGLGLSLPQGIFAGLAVREVSPDAGYYPTWVNNTRSYLGTPDPVTGRGTAHPEINVVIWAWCGQVSTITEQTLLSNYLLPMNQLEVDYPGIVFVYMTGHADGSGETGNLHLRNQQIRQYAIDNNKVLYDFYDIELYDPDGNYYGDLAVNDDCDYDLDGDGIRESNWCIDWQNTHTLNLDWYNVNCAHSRSLNCNQKAYAAWWLWASLAGWNETPPALDLSPSEKTANQGSVLNGDTLTYTIQIENANGPITQTVQLTDSIPPGLAYVPGSLAATSGSVDDSSAPELRWTGVLTPTPSVTITYAVEVTEVDTRAITNTAMITIPGYDPVNLSATVIANGYRIYLPLVWR